MAIDIYQLPQYTDDDINTKLESFARWLSAHPGEWNLWPFLIPWNKDRDVMVDGMRTVIQRVKNGFYDSFRVDRSLLEIDKSVMVFDPGHIARGGIALRMRIKA